MEASRHHHFTDKPYFLWGFGLFCMLSCVLLQGRSTGDTAEPAPYHVIDSPVVETIARQQQETIPVTEVPASLQARYALLMDADNRRVLYEKNGYEKAPMASTTKIMTLLITLENGNLDDLVTVSEYAASMPDVQLNMKQGEQYRLGDLVYSLMLESHNDTAVAIAEHIGGSVEGFADLMNAKAQELGAYDTHFVTPNGLDREDHYTTAYDLALIASYAIENEDFLNIVQTASYTFHEQTTGKCFTVNNKDRFLTSYEGALGIKTGFTGNAGYCFVGAAERQGKRLVSVVLASGWPPNRDAKWKDTTALMNYGMENYAMQEVLSAGTTFSSVPVTGSIEGEPITPYVEEGVSLLLRSEEEVTIQVALPEELQAPVQAGETVGSVTVEIDGTVYQVLPLYAGESRAPITYSYVLRQLLYRYFLVQ
jgi:D-alanyl-D-alanine carboxypeptidase (penicillin-binding protein 5/6)